jgi:hypothetical protein
MIAIEQCNGLFCFSTGDIRLNNASFYITTPDSQLRSNKAVLAACREGYLSHGELGPGRFFRYNFRWEGEDIAAEYQIYLPDSSPSASLSLRVVNDGGAPVSIKSLTLFSLSDGGLGLGEGLRDWAIYKNGIRKNDLVSVYRFGSEEFDLADVTADGNEDASFTKRKQDGDALVINSNYLTVIHSASNGSSFLAGFYTVHRQFSHTQLICDKAESRMLSYEAFCDLDGIFLDKKASVESEKILLDFSDSFEAIERYASLAARTGGGKGKQSPLTGWCSWYYFYESVSEADILKNIEFITVNKLNVSTVLIDMGWEERLGSWYPGSKFPHGMKWLADKIHSAGLKAGLWLSPFWVENRSEIHREHPEWLLRDKAGRLLVFNCHIDGYVIDTTIPEARGWIRDIFKKVVAEWGFDLVKIDFLRAVSLFPEARYSKNVTRAEALRLGLEAVREGAGEETFIIACGGHYGPTLGIANANRTSNDIGANWESFKKTFKKNILRYWMHQRWWINDPDCLVIRSKDEGEGGRIAGYPGHTPKGSFNDIEVETITTVFQSLEAMIFLGDDLPLLSPEKILKLRDMLAVKRKGEVSLIPRDLFYHRYSHILDTRIDDLRHRVVIINWNDSKLVEAPALWELIGKEQSGAPYHLYSMPENKFLGICLPYEKVPEYAIEPHGSLILFAERSC